LLPGRAVAPGCALWIAKGANPKEVAARAGHASVSFTLDRYGHLYPEADDALRARLDALLVDARPAGEATGQRAAPLNGCGPRRRHSPTRHTGASEQGG
jgi:hypothetical protein